MMHYINPRLKLFHHLDRLAMIKRGGAPAPVNAEVDLSNRCQAGCRWCHFAHVHSRGPGAGRRRMNTGDLMDTGLALRLVDELEECGIRSVTWSGGGEPALHPEFGRIVEATGIDQGVYTNGIGIDGDLAALLKRQMCWMYVSLDCSDRESYEREKGVDGFGAACEAVKALVEAEGPATVGVGFLLHRDNWTHVFKMLMLGRSLGTDYVQFRPAVAYNFDEPGWPAEDASWVTAGVELLARVGSNKGVEVDLGRFERYRDWTAHGYATCWWSALQTVVTPDGRMFACANKRGLAEAEMGNLNEETFADVWARRQVQVVDRECRVLCRGDIPNLALGRVMGKPGPGRHRNFI